ncbi:hypothetical protein [Peromfec virus RodF8_50]|uniref:Uncharacterized protein n=1 Tax=Peromfec virus RodF8_50 TaxID=2929380 RepID=A0A976N316_9VIRU|nr:hypothetical protein [Peromfec virus RodF8_50]
MYDIVDIIPYIVMALSFLLNFLNMVYTRKTGKSIDTEVNEIMKNRLPSYRESETTSTGQSFDPLVTQYRFNKTTGELEELPDKLDIQKFVDSSLNTSLEAMFDKFLSPTPTDNILADLTDTRDKLDRLSDAMEFADELREKYGLSDDTSLSDVYGVLEADINSTQEKAVKTAQENASKAVDDALLAKFKSFMASQSGVKDET